MVWLVAGWCVLVSLAWLGGLARAVQSAHDPRYRVGPERPPQRQRSRSRSIPARNEEAVIEACIAGALAQDHPSVEVVVLDDGSTDETATRLAAFPDVRVIEARKSRCQGMARSPGLAIAQRHARDWLLFVDADVRLAPEAVRERSPRSRARAGPAVGLGQLENGTLGERILMPAVTGAIPRIESALGGQRPERPEKPSRAGSSPSTRGL